MTNQGKGSLVAFALAGLFAGACATTDSNSAGPTQTASVHCTGVNACKGTGSCKSAGNACAGQNACKGAGWVNVASAGECSGKGGKVAQ